MLKDSVKKYFQEEGKKGGIISGLAHTIRNQRKAIGKPISVAQSIKLAKRLIK